MAYHCGWEPVTLAGTHSFAPCGSLNWLQLLTPIPSESHEFLHIKLSGNQSFRSDHPCGGSKVPILGQYLERSCNVAKIMQHRKYLQDSETLRSAIPTAAQT